MMDKLQKRPPYELICEFIKPESPLEDKIIQDPEFQKGVLWGSPRPGHPEGMVLYHVQDVLASILMRYKTAGFFAPIRTELRLIAIIHDSFKAFVDPGQPKSGENHHAMRARRFAEKFISIRHILDIIELHDEAYNAWQKGNRDKQWDKADMRVEKLIDRLENSHEHALFIYTKFYECDSSTDGKKNDDFHWWLRKVEDRMIIPTN